MAPAPVNVQLGLMHCQYPFNTTSINTHHGLTHKVDLCNVLASLITHFAASGTQLMLVYQQQLSGIHSAIQLLLPHHILTSCTMSLATAHYGCDIFEVQ